MENCLKKRATEIHKCATAKILKSLLENRCFLHPTRAPWCQVRPSAHPIGVTREQRPAPFTPTYPQAVLESNEVSSEFLHTEAPHLPQLLCSRPCKAVALLWTCTSVSFLSMPPFLAANIQHLIQDAPTRPDAEKIFSPIKQFFHLYSLWHVTMNTVKRGRSSTPHSRIIPHCCCNTLVGTNTDVTLEHPDWIQADVNPHHQSEFCWLWWREGRGRSWKLSCIGAFEVPHMGLMLLDGLTSTQHSFGWRQGIDWEGLDEGQWRICLWNIL